MCRPGRDRDNKRKELDSWHTVQCGGTVKMNRRNFLRLIGIGGTVSLAIPVFADQPDVRGWRFGVWELQYSISPRDYWARCDCGAEQAVGLDELLNSWG